MALDGASGDIFGISVAISDGTVVVGAHQDDDNGSGAGSAYVFPICRAIDTTAPRLSVVLAPDTIWPPSHHMVEITATVTVSDDCTTPSVVLTSLSSDEPDDAPGVGDGKTTGDIQPGTDDFHFSLRAERAGTGNGRVYTAVYTATDEAGNVATETVCVVVPHDRRGRARVQLCSP